MLLTLLLACGAENETGQTDPSTEPQPEETGDILVAAEIDFGSLAVGESAVQALLIQNAGEGELNLSSVSIEGSSDVVLSGPDLTSLTTGGLAQVQLTWTPSSPGDLNATLVIQSDDPDAPTTSIVLSGEAAGPVIDITISEHDFGEVGVGCANEVALTVTNNGTTDLTISEVSLTNSDGEFKLDADEYTMEVFPWVLKPGYGQEFTLEFAPSLNHETAAIIELYSDDLVTPRLQVQTWGVGTIEEEASDTFDVDEQTNATALFAMNDSNVVGGWRGEVFWDSIDVFFDTLLESGVPFRVAFLLPTDGSVSGDVPYIDDSYTTSEAVEIVGEMMTNGMGDNDAQFSTLNAGLQQQGDWLFEEDGNWNNSRLSLIAINHDTEQSGGSAKSHLNNYLSYKEDPADIIFHAIGGDPDGSGGGSCEPYTQPYNATVLTGGYFLDYCDTSWAGHMEKIAEAVRGDFNAFVLSENPAPYSINVKIDGLTLQEGWSYSEVTNAVLFEEKYFPDSGSEVVIDYHSLRRVRDVGACSGRRGRR